jgi:uncharacterized protein (TIGR00661 family)
LSQKKPRILVAPLAWGLGHATRCVPIIRYLLRHGCEVVIASDGDALSLLKHEFPDQHCIGLPPYQVHYRSGNMVHNIAFQLPKLILTVRREHKAIQQIIKDYEIDGIISDNRYGVFSDSIPSVLITHQLHILTNHFLASITANLMVKHAISQFDQIWVPDYAPKIKSLTGVLSHGVTLAKPIHYIGPLSRMNAEACEREYDVAIVLSGPEPQRSRLESALLEQALTLPMNFIFVQGKPDVNRQYFAADHVEVVSYLTSSDLNRVINSSKVMVCRSGYSSIMDLIALRKKALLIPTPGQTEQEYLASHLEHEGILPFQHQDAIALEAGVKTLSQYTGFDEMPLDHFEDRIRKWLLEL